MVLRRMRMPLMILISSYSISILGMVLIPGVDEQGNPWRMDFFHAFYFVTYTASTIGFGEIPYTFTAAQRVWATICVYISVISWFYAIGTILAVIQDHPFRHAVIESSFRRSIKRIHEPFYLICGFGEIGRAMVHALTELAVRVVVIDVNEERVNLLKLEGYAVHVPALCGDAMLPDNLIKAGLTHRHCAGVISLSASDQVNLKVAITVKSLRAELPVICRAESKEVEANMASFGTDHIIDPFDTFADGMAMALRSPGLHLLYNWLTGVSDTVLTEPVYPPHGTWLLCGYGRFGRAIHKRFREEGISTVILEPKSQLLNATQNAFVGLGTEAKTLIAAGIDQAAGIVAGTDNDENNLSIIMTARSIKPGLFVVARQNKHFNRTLFRAISPDIPMRISDIVARKIRMLLAAPMVNDFFEIARKQDKQWANVAISRLCAVIGDIVPEVWSVEITPEKSPAVTSALKLGRKISLLNLMQDPRARERNLSCVPLMLMREGEGILIPEDHLSLQSKDRILFCGNQGIAASMQWVLRERHALNYVMTINEDPDGYLLGWLYRRLYHVDRRKQRRMKMMQ